MASHPAIDLQLHDDDARVLTSVSGRTLVLESGPIERLTVTDPEGRFELAIRFTAAGPVLDVAAIGLTLRADADVVLDCDRLRVSARAGIRMETHGDLVECVRGDRTSEVDGALASRAASVSLRAEDGALEIAAVEDTRIEGRRVLLNP